MRCILINEEKMVVNIISYEGGTYDPSPLVLVPYPEEENGVAHIGWYYHEDTDRALPERPEE